MAPLNRKGNAVLIFSLVGVIVLVAAIAALHFSGNSLFSIIGEEGYEPYDPLLLSGSFDQSKWIYANTTYDGGNFGCVGSATSCNGGVQVCSSPLTPYTGVTAGSNSITVSPVGFGRNTGYTGPYLRTVNLRLIDFKADWSISVTRCSSNKWWHGGGVIKTNRGDVYTFPEGSGTSPTGPVGIELNWDDYTLGHYQIKANGQVVQEGTVAEGEELYFQIEPDTASCTSECSGTATLTNPRWKRLFGCDLQEGELQTDACFGGPQTVTTDDLPGFKRFCISSPSTFVDAGVSTSSKRVYYDLAQGKPVVIGANQAWKFSYIADAPLIGNRTGISSHCEQTTVDDLVDLPVPDPSIQGQSLYWTSYGRYEGSRGFKSLKTDLNSGTQAFMKTSVVQIDENLCPYKDDDQYFPKDGLPASCFSVSAFGKTFRQGDSVQLSGMSVKLQNISVRYERDETLGKLYRWTATWRMDFQPSAVQIDLSRVPSVVDPNASAVSYPVKNTLPGPGTFITTVQARPEILNEPIQQTYTTNLAAGATGSVSIKLPATYQGTHRAIAWNTLQTEVGGISFQISEATYSTTTAADGSTNDSSWWDALCDWFARLWNAIKELFR